MSGDFPVGQTSTTFIFLNKNKRIMEIESVSSFVSFIKQNLGLTIGIISGVFTASCIWFKFVNVILLSAVGPILFYPVFYINGIVETKLGFLGALAAKFALGLIFGIPIFLALLGIVCIYYGIAYFFAEDNELTGKVIIFPSLIFSCWLCFGWLAIPVWILAWYWMFSE